MVAPGQTAPEPSAAPWYKRRFVYDRPDHRPAGSRPKTLAHEVRRRRNRAITLGVSLTVALTAAVATWGFSADLDRTREQALDRMNGLAEVRPTSDQSAPTTKGHEAKKTTDGKLGTWWQPRGRKKTLTYEFNPATRLVGIVIWPGKSDRKEEFQRMSRPSKIRVETFSERLSVIEDEEGRSSLIDYVDWFLADAPGPQVRNMTVAGVKSVRLTVTEIYEGEPYKDLAIREVLFATRKSAATPSPTG